MGPDLNKLLLQRNRELEAAGYHAQVHVEPTRPCSSCWKAASASPSGNCSYSPEQLAERAEQLSPNALLRPVVQDYMLPTAAYIGGPAELAYFAQSQVLYERLLGHMPRLVSRSGFTLFDVASRQVDGALPSASEGLLPRRRSAARTHRVPTRTRGSGTALRRGDGVNRAEPG